MIHLKNTTDQAEAAVGSYGSAAILTTIDAQGVPAGQATFRNRGTVGFWYITLNRASGPTTSDYSIKLGPGECHTESDPPFGDIYALAGAGANGPLSWYVGWSQ